MTTEEKQIWTFSYHRGKGQYTGYVRAKDQALGYAVAVAWCEKNRCRPPAQVFPFILADESILPAPPEELPVKKTISEKIGDRLVGVVS